MGLQEVLEYKYLGVIVAVDGATRLTVAPEAARRLEAVQGIVGLLRGTGLLRGPPRLTRTLWTSLVQPVAEWGGDVLTLSVEQTARLEVVQNDVLRQALGAPLRAPVDCLRGDIGGHAGRVSSRRSCSTRRCGPAWLRI